jgi:hypothetical protein
MAYCTWQDVEAVYPEASNVITSTSDRTNLLTRASGLADNLLAKAMHVPVPARDDGTYDPVIVEAVANIAADLVAIRRVRGEDDVTTESYGATAGRDGLKFTGTLWGHRGMGMLDGLVQGRLATDEQVTAAEAAQPEVDESGLSNSNGTIECRYKGGRFHVDRVTRYVVTISSAGGTVAGDDLTFTATRDNDEEIWTDHAVLSPGWIEIEHGLQIRFRDADAAPVWAEDDYVVIEATPFEARDVVKGSLVSMDMPLG